LASYNICRLARLFM